MSQDAGSVVTTEGRMDPSDLGVTLPHEHVFLNNAPTKFQRPDSAVEQRMAREPVKMENLWWIRRNAYSNRDNMRFDSMEDAVEELGHYRRAGGDAVVDVTAKNKGGDPEAVRAVGRETGLTTIQGTAFYTRDAHPDRVAEMSVDEVTAEFVSDVREGIDDTDVRAGIIGEVGITGDEHDKEHRFVHPEEEKVLRAGARAASRTGAPLSVHPPSHRSEEWPTSRRCHQVLDVCEEEGLDLDRVILCHRDQSKWLEADLEYQRELADRGAYVEFDLFAHRDAYHAAFDDAQASDLDRVKWIEELVAEGYHDRLLLSHDIYMKIFLRKYGGFGYAHLLDVVVPILEQRGVADDVIDTMLVDNPARILAFAEPSA